MDYKRHMDIAKQAAVIAGEKIVEIYETDFEKTIEVKDDNSPLTIADKTANEIIVNMLKKEFPEISILAEESALDESRFENDLCWIIDPLDGTKEFIKRNGEFTVNIALAYKHKSVMGVIYIPVREELFFAAEGIGAFKEADGKTTEIHVTDKTSDLIVARSKSHTAEELLVLLEKNKHLVRESVPAGSAIKGTMVAEGTADVYYRYGYTSEWDTAAMQCIVECAGGIFRQMDGSEMIYNRHDSKNRKGFFVVNRKENIWV